MAKSIVCGLNGCTRVFRNQWGLKVHRSKTAHPEPASAKVPVEPDRAPVREPDPPKDTDTVEQLKLVLGSLIGKRTSIESEIRKLRAAEIEQVLVEQEIAVVGKAIEQLREAAKYTTQCQARKINAGIKAVATPA
jgi:hypothetical protein